MFYPKSTFSPFPPFFFFKVRAYPHDSESAFRFTTSNEMVFTSPASTPILKSLIASCSVGCSGLGNDALERNLARYYQLVSETARNDPTRVVCCTRGWVLGPLNIYDFAHSLTVDGRGNMEEIFTPGWGSCQVTPSTPGATILPFLLLILIHIQCVPMREDRDARRRGFPRPPQNP